MLILLQNIISFILLVLIQVLALNNIQFLGYVNPYIYILFILSLPVKIPHWVLLLLAFVLGLTIDAFSNTMGMNAFATVLVAFLRPIIIKLFITIEEGANPNPSIRTFGVSAYIKYALLMVLIHQFILFYLEVFSFQYFWTTFFKVLVNSSVTILILLGIVSLKNK